MGRKFTHNAQRLLALVLVFLMAFGQMDIVIASGIADQLSEQQSVSEPVTTQAPIPSGKQADEGVQNTTPPTQPPEETKPPEKTGEEATAEPTKQLEVSKEPTAEPTVEATVPPTVEPTAAPTAIATAEPTVEPTAEPTVPPTVEPTAIAAAEPTVEPTVEPTAEPTVEPTAEPTVEPTAEPTQVPAADPTQQPTSEPTAEPTVEPTTEPTAEPTPVVTAEPTPAPMRMTAQMRIMAAEGVNMIDAAAVVEKAIADNISLELPYVSISATALSDEVPTGEAFTYSLYIYLRNAPQYNIEADGNVIDAYKKYDKATVTITAPENIDLYNADGSLFARAGETKEIVYENVAMGKPRRFELKGQMTNNGEAEDGTEYAALGIAMSADVTVTNVNTGKTTKHSFTEDKVPVTNNTQVSNQASNEWTVEKEAKKEYDATSNRPEKKTVDGVECYVFEYTIKAGKAKDGKVLANDNDYNVYGTLDFSSFELTDTLPVIAETATGVKNAKPVWASIVLNGETVAEQTNVQDGVTKLTTKEYTRKDFREVAGSKVPGEIPYYSEYTVKVAYPVEYFFLPYGKYDANTQPFEMENKAEIHYTPLGEAQDKADDIAELTYIEKGEPARLVGYKKLIVNKAEVAYEGEWKSYFSGGAEFSVYAADNWNEDAGEPINADEKVGVLVVGGTTETTNQSQILYLSEGTYYVKETKAPDKTKVTGEPQKVELVAGQLKEVTFVNEVDGMGLLELKKVDDQGTPMAVTFELWPVGQVGNGNPVASGTTSSTDGVLHMLVPVGAYILHEVTPTDYIPVADQEVTIKDLSAEGRTTLSGGAIVNESNLATLTIKKYAYANAQGSGNKVDFTQANTGYDPTQIKFKLSWMENGVAQEAEIPLQANGQAVKSPLKRKNNDGTYIRYTLTEISAPDGVVKDTASISWQFDETDGKYNYTAEFTNRIQSQLKIKKQQQDLGDDGKVVSSYPEGVTFKVYRKTGENSYEEKATIVTGQDGVATTTGYLDVADANGPIQYYVVETTGPSGYQVTYPASATIQVGGQDVQAWGPITLNNNPVTDKTSSLVVNKETKGRIEVTKVDAANTGKKLQGAEFTLSGSDGSTKTAATDANGVAVFNDLKLNVTYTLTETKAPDGYVATYQGEKITLDTPLKVFTVTVNNTAKPFLKVKKTAKDVTTGTPSTLSGVTFEVYQKQTDESFTRVGTLSLTTGANGESGTVQLPAAGVYYLKEAAYPDSVLTPEDHETLYSGKGELSSGSFYFGPFEAKNGETAICAIENILNSGKLTVTKKDAKTDGNITVAEGKQKAQFTVTVANVEESTSAGKLLKNADFTFDAEKKVWSRTVEANPSTTLGSLPLYNGKTPITYTVTETQAPDGYLLTDTTPQTFALANQSGYTAAATFKDAPQATLRVNKVWLSRWNAQGHVVAQPLAGAELAVYEIDADGVLHYANQTATTDALGNAVFTGLDGTKQYVVVEVKAPDGYSLPDNMSELASANALDGWKHNDVKEKYNFTEPCNFFSDKQTPNDMTIEKSLVNYDNWVQFKLTKFIRNLKGENTDEPLDHAKFVLHSCTVQEFRETYGSKMNGAAPTDGKVYETGTAQDASGNKIEGVLLTDVQEAGLVYWFEEIEAPSGYEIIEEYRFVGPFVPEGSGIEDGIPYKLNQITSTDKVYNQELSGPGTDRFMQVELNKILINKDTKEFISNLSDVTFELWITDESGKRIELLDTMVTGKDMANAGEDPEEAKEVAGFAMSVSFSLTDRLKEDPAKYANAIQRIEGKNGEYKVHLTLVETKWPLDASPVQTEYSWWAETNGETYTVDDTHVVDPIENTQEVLVPVRVRKMGYDAGDTDKSEAKPLEDVKFGVWTNAQCTGEPVAEAVTGADGYAEFRLKPNTEYWLKEMTTAEGYQKDDAIRAFTTPNYGATYEISEPVYNVSYPEVQLKKINADGTGLEGVRFKITKTDGSQITDPDGNTISNASDGYYVTTESNGETDVFSLPVGSYKVEEVEIPGRTKEQTDVLTKYFDLLNTTTITLKNNGTTNVFTFTNPDLGALEVTKVNEAKEGIEGVPFAIEFKAFTAKDEWDAQSTADSGFAKPAWLKESYTTDSGKISLTGLIPGWYKLIETVPEGYEGAGTQRSTIVKVTAQGMGQTDATVPAEAEIENVRKGTLKITKSFAQTGLAQIPETLTFNVYKGPTGGTPVNQLELTFGNGALSATGSIDLDHGTYYIEEAAQGWYAQYSVDGEAKGWLNGQRMEVTVESNTEVLLNVENVPAYAFLEIYKTDDNTLEPKPVEGVVFKIYYKDGNNKVYLKDGAADLTLTTDAQGIAQAKITLPQDRVMAETPDSTYYIEEISAPVGYALAADREITLKPGTVYQGSGRIHIEDATAVVIELTKYGRTKANLDKDTTADAETKALLKGATFELYTVSGDEAKLYAVDTTGDDGKISFGNLPKLTDGSYYALRETAVPGDYVEGSLELYEGDSKLEPVSVAGMELYKVTENEDVSLKAYNTPKAGIAVLKYNYFSPKDSGKVPVGAMFKLTDENGNIVGSERGTAQVGASDTLDITRYAASNGTWYVGNSGEYEGYLFSYAQFDGLEPGTYTVTETKPAENYFQTPESQPGDPWYPVAEVVVGDDGEAAVCYFANVEKNQHPDLKITKQVSAINGDSQATQIVGGLQAQEQQVTFKLSDFSSTEDKPFEVKLKQLELKDNDLKFYDGNQSETGVEVEHYVTEIKIGAARYLPTKLNPNPVQETITAKLYGLKGTDQTLIGTYELSAAQIVTLPEDTYTGFLLVYGEGTGLLEGFQADPVEVTMSFVQEDDAAVVPAASIENTAQVRMAYNVGTKEDEDTWTGWKSDIDVVTIDDAQQLPKASLTKTVQLLDEDGNPAAPDPDGLVSAKPGDWLLYTIVFSNVSDLESGLAIVNPVVLDQLPEYVAVDSKNVAVTSTGGGVNVETTMDSTTNRLVIKDTEELLPGQSLTVEIKAMVRYSAVEATVEEIVNHVYAGSLEQLPKNKENPYGASFTDVNGILPTEVMKSDVIGTASDYVGLHADASFVISQEQNLSLYKQVTADLSDAQQGYVSADEYATASVGGWIRYKLTLYNGGTALPGQVRIVDKLPAIDDVDIGSTAQRGSKWPVTLDSISGVEYKYLVTDESNPNAEKKYATRTLDSSEYTIYTTTQEESGNNYVSAVRNQNIDSGVWQPGIVSGAKAFLIAFDEKTVQLKEGESLTLVVEADPPAEDDPKLNDYYYEMSVNNSVAGVVGKLTTNADSPSAKVVLFPEQVGLGNRVWVDKNADGLQDSTNYDNSGSVVGDEPAFSGATGITFTLRKYDGDGASIGTETANPDGNGYYFFDGLYPAKLKDGVDEEAAYTGGNLNPGQLKGVLRNNYQLVVSGIPEGYFVTEAFAGRNDGTAPHFGLKEEAFDSDNSNRKTDSNFKANGDGTYSSERFYLSAKGDDLSKDLGLVRYRHLQLIKLEEVSKKPVEGAVFTIYGPYTDDEIEAIKAGTKTDWRKDEDTVGTMTTDNNGFANFESTGLGHYLNFYQNYIVEETSVGAGYKKDSLKVSDSNSGSNVESLTINGTAVSAFVLKAMSDSPPEANPGVTVNEVDATNKYESKGEIIIGGTKSLTGRDLEDAPKFSFTLTGEHKGGKQIKLTATNDANGAFAFGKIEYTQEDINPTTMTGSYEYTVSEVKGNEASYTYSNVVYKVKVNLEDNGEGKIKATPVITYVDKDGVTQTVGEGGITFENHYTATGSTVIEGTKNLTGRDLEDKQFEFVLSRKADDPATPEVEYQEIGRTRNDTAGKFSFGLNYTQANVEKDANGEYTGEYEYKITEVDAGAKGYTYSKAEYMVKVTLKDNGAGHIEATQTIIQPADASQNAFVNTYKAVGKLNLTAKKVLTGRTLEKGKFEFVLKEVGGELELTATNDALGNVAFPTLVYTEDDVDPTTHKGEVTYQMRERVTAPESGYTYSEVVYTVKVSLTDNGDGSITAAKPVITYVDEEGVTQTVNEALFENAYNSEGGLILSGVKLLSGRKLENQQFGFVLEAENAAQGKFTLEARNDANGAFAFDEITYTEADVDPTTHTGSYEYTVREVDEGETGYNYSGVVYTVTVTLEDRDGRIKATTAIKGTDGSKELKFSNEYHSEGEVIIGGTKSLTGRDLEDAPKFSFTLTGEHKGGKQIKLTATNDANGAFAFDKITYTEADVDPETHTGSYEYTVTEEKQNEAGYTYSEVVYKVKVNLEDDGEGKITATPVITYVDKDGVTQTVGEEGITFENHYTATGSTVIEGTKNLTGRDLEDKQFEFVLSRKADDPATPEVEYQEIGRTRNDAAGKFSFGLNYTLADVEKDANGEYTGEYEYKITEVDAGAKGYTYSKAEYTVKVTLKDNGDGSIGVQKEIEGGGAILFENSYASTGSTVIQGTKSLTGRDLEDGQFEFVLKEVGGELELTAQNDEEGKIVFPAIHYTQQDVDPATHEGEYTYQVYESNQDEAGYTYSDVVYTVKVSLTDNGDGTITPTQTVVEPSGETQIAFENSYEAEGNLSLNAQKVLTGRQLEADQFEFVLVAQNAAQGNFELNARNDAQGRIIFPAIEYTEADVDEATHQGEYIYQMYEKAMGEAGYTYSKRVYTIKVSLTDNGDGTITAIPEITYVDENGATQTVNEALFENSYQTGGGLILSGVKLLSGRKLEDQQFGFVLEAENAAQGKFTLEARNDANGAFAFDEITYTEADVDPATHTGSYEYTVREVNEGETGYTYSDVVYTVRVSLTDNGAGEISASAEIEGTNGGDALVFTNEYNADGRLRIEGTKRLEPRALNADDVFTFVLRAQNAAQGEFELRAQNDITGAFAFDEIEFTQADLNPETHTGEYVYTLYEENDGLVYYGYDATRYQLTVSLTEDGEGNVQASITEIRTADGQAVEEILFTNSYQAVGGAYIEATKQLERGAEPIRDGEFSFELYEVVDGAIGQTPIARTTNSGVKIAFPRIEYEFSNERDDRGTHTYIMREVRGTDENMIYSEQEFQIVVEVTDDEKGNLIARVDYADQSMTFVNSALETRVSGVKTWNDYDNRFGTRPESITVNLYADGERIQSATVTAADNWAYAFENLPTNRVDPATGAIRQIVYTVDEEPVAGYTGEVVSAGEQTSGRERSVAVNLTNTVHELRISKRTAEGAGLAGARLRLFKVEDEMIPVDTWTSTAGVHTIYGLEAGTYRLVELDAPMGYDVALPIRIVIHEDGTVESDALRGDTVVMVDDLSSGRINITGLKYWVDRNNEAGERPENINVTLYADGEAVDQQPTWTKYDNIWEYAFTGLLEENLDGSRIVYTVREEAVPNYDTTYDGLNITNTIQAPSYTFTGIVGQKTWVDNDNAQGRRPEAITVYLRRDGVVVDSQQVTEAGNWTYSFQNLPETNGYGRRYTYTIDEAAVPGYFKRVNGYDLTNTLITTREVTPPERPPRTPEENVTLITMLDAEVPLFGGLLKTGDELPVYPFVFGGIGLMAAIAAFILSRKKRAVKEGR